jgi:hypothetical protein
MADDGGQVIDQFFADLRRWIEELERQDDQRSTLWFGIGQRAFGGFDHFLEWIIERAASSNPEEAQSVLRPVLAEKPLGKSTLGQKVNIVQSLDRHRLLCDRRILTKSDIRSLTRVTTDRNEAAHSYGRDTGHGGTLKMLRVILDLSQRLGEAVDGPRQG